MFDSRSNNNKTTYLHEKCLQLIYSEKSYEELLKRGGSVSLHHKNIQATAIDMFKNLNGMSPEITNDLFVQITENQCNLRHLNDFNIPHIRTVYHGS